MPGGLRVKRWVSARSEEPYFYRVGHMLSSKHVAPFGKGVENVVSGMKERVFYIDEQGTQRPPCRRGHLELGPLTERLVRHIGPCNRATGADFISTRTGSKKKMYEQARQNLLDRPRTLSELAVLQYFTKYESTVHSKRQVPRIVSPRSFEFNYLLGRYMRAIEHTIFDALPTLFKGIPVVAKGLTQLEKGELIAEKLRGKVAVGLDASRFDQTIGRELLKAEHSLYLGLFPGDRLLAGLLDCQLRNRGKAHCHDGYVAADIGAMRCSGDQNTSLGNCIVSCLLARLFMDETGIDGDVINDGDDLVMFVAPEDLPKLERLEAWYLDWGLRMKVEQPSYTPEEVEFCQSKPVWTPRGYLLVRNPAKVFNTDYCGSHKVALEEDYRVHLRAVGLCGLAMAAGIPMLQEYYVAGVRCGKTGKLKEELGGKFYQAKIELRAGAVQRAIPIDIRTRFSFEKAFGICPLEQEAYEGVISSFTLSRLHECESDWPNH